MKPLLKRTLSGAIFLVIVVCCLLNRYLYLALFSFLAIMLSAEFYSLTLEKGRFIKEKVLVIVSAITLLLTGFCCKCYGADLRWVALSILPVMLAFVMMLRDCADDHSFEPALFFPVVYVAFPVASTLFLVFGQNGVYEWRLIFGVLILAWMNDIGAYIFGMGFGQRPNSRKLAPKLSPKKSWAGIYGGTAFSLCSAVAIWAIFGSSVLPLVHWLAIAFITSVFGVCGDLFESLIKRHADVKDSGNFIPGHGGVLDRFDDILFVFPISVVYLLTVAQI